MAGVVQLAVATPNPDGVLVQFSAPETFAAGSLKAFLNGAWCPAATEDGGLLFSMPTAPKTGDELVVEYEKPLP